MKLHCIQKKFTSSKTVIFCFISVLECILELAQLFWIGFRTRLICLKYKQVEISLSAIKDDDDAIDVFWGEERVETLVL